MPYLVIDLSVSDRKMAPTEVELNAMKADGWRLIAATSRCLYLHKEVEKEPVKRKAKGKEET